ncbi:DUF6924 domain-containing protein [Streptomyces halobius]|uniref:DUF6924 domain-containing protein n=1 Tax=Streptomyces halobius TaxID=2879846 RepID=A0ABY4M7Q3_9ACTN|nr:hypothetical protein [Streptomyces halobius]UQA92401.1 hypothetical protein K9S39_11625 [Streptomyces halobius]
MSVQALIDEEAAADEDDEEFHIFHAFFVDTTTFTDPSRPLLAVDLHNEPGRTFRVPARWFPQISANPSIADMDVAEYADPADASGAFRGFDDG